jgi:HAMP domain-containing protein
MKLTFSFQTLIMSVLAAVLTLATAFWALAVYDSIYRIILRGFDQKLQALAGGAAVFTDGDAHADYQRPHRISAICGGGAIWGYDEERGRFVEIDSETGGALPLEPQPTPPQAVAELACAIEGGQLLMLDAAGGLHWLRGEPLPLRGDLPALQEILHIDGDWWGRSGAMLYPLLDPGVAAGLDQDSEAGAVADPAAIAAASDGAGQDPARATEPVASRRLGAAIDRLAWDTAGQRFIGVGIEAGEVVEFAADGRVLRRFPVDLDGRHIQGLVVQGDTALLAANALLSVDLAAEALAEESPSPGYYSESHPFIERYAPAYRQVREAAGLTFLYTEQILAGNQLRYILDGSEGDDHTPPGYEDIIPEDTLEELQAAQGQGRGFISDIRQWEAWGLIKLAAEPILASDGRVVALAGADVDIGVIRGKTRIALFAVLGVGVGLLLLAAWVSLRVSRSLTRPLREIKDGALRIAAGYFSQPPQARGRDEIAGLARSLSALGARLQSQERQSRVYQQTLISGRMQLALEHALRDECLLAASGLPFQPPGEAERPLLGAAAGDAAGSLYWLRDGEVDGLELARDQARCVQLARALLRRHDLSEAQDRLLAADPALQCVLAWLPDSRALRVRTRSAQQLQRCEADGRCSPVNLADGIQLQPRDCAALELPGGWRLLLQRSLEESGA